MVAPSFLGASQELGVQLLVVLDAVYGELEEAVEGNAVVGRGWKGRRVRKGREDGSKVRVGLDGRERVEAEGESGSVTGVGGFEVGDPPHEEVAESFW